MRTFRWLSLLAPLALAACDSSTTEDVSAQSVRVPGEMPGTHRQYGAPVRVGDGRARAYTVIDRRNGSRPIEIGVALDARALENLPEKMAHPGGGDGHAHVDSHEYLLPLPANHGTPFKLIELNWNPAGHEPPGIYDVPHFDFHFYTITKAERDAIVPSDPQFMTKAARYPGPEYVPAGYMVLPPPPAPAPAVPKMGVHWSNLASPELQPPGLPNHAPFSQTFIFGSWDGRFIFAEPMITRAYLLSKPNVTIPLSQPAKYAGSGYAPTSYRITWDARAKEYRIALSGLTLR